MCAATSQMVAKVAELMELRKMIEDLNAEAELIADEIKAYMGEEETIRNSAAYIQNWLKVLRDDKRFIVSASGRAEKAVNLILGSVG